MTAIEQRSMSRYLSIALPYVGVFAASTTFVPDEALAAHRDLWLLLEAGEIWSVQPIHFERPVT